MQAQEIIVYRNPGEKALWDLLQSPSGFWLFAIFVSALIGGYFLAVFQSKTKNRFLQWFFALIISSASMFLFWLYLTF